MTIAALCRYYRCTIADIYDWTPQQWDAMVQAMNEDAERDG